MVEEAADDDAIEAVEETVTAEAEDEAVEVVEEFTHAETEDDTADAVEETVVAEVEDDAVDAVEETVAVEVAAEAEDDAVEEAIADEAEDDAVGAVEEAVAAETEEDAADTVEDTVAAEVKDDAADTIEETIDAGAEDEPVEAVAASEGALDLSAWRTDDPLPADIPEIDPDQDEDRAPVSGAHARVIKIQRAGDDAKAHPAEPDAPVEESTSRSAIFAALVDDIDPDADEEPQNEELEAEDDATLLAGIDAAIGGAGDKTEDDLARELAEFAREARRDAHEGRAILESTSGDGEASVERLMEEAKSKLEGVENRRRFTAISHLKAAVAATVADRKLSSTHDPIPQAPDAADADMNRYRDDLSKAVRPRRPEAPVGSTTPRPKTEIPATPLVLVTEQRIDEGDHDHDEAVRPRRISAGTFLHDDEDDEDFEYGSDGAPISPDDAKSFAEFAERLGANGLPELLEAAAAYTATVEGQPHFSRPEILRKVADVTEETDFSREAGLRTFGLLLREGKIQKISRGQFTITGTSKFLAEEKTASR